MIDDEITLSRYCNAGQSEENVDGHIKDQRVVVLYGALIVVWVAAVWLCASVAE